MSDDFNELGGLSDGLGGLGGLTGDASMRERDAANMAGQDMGMGFGDAPQSLSDFDTQGMGDGLSAMKEGLGSDDSGMELNAALADEEEDAPIHAALQDEEEDAPIRAGRADSDPIHAGFGQPQNATDNTTGSGTGNVERSSFDGYGLSGSNLANDPSQNIDDIFIAGSYNRSSAGSSASSGGGGTMYDPSKEHTDVHVSFGMPPLLKKLLILVCIIAVAFGVLKYGFHVKIENYFHPQDVQEYVEYDADTLASTLGVKFKDQTEHYQSSVYDYTYNVAAAGGLKLVDYDGKRLYIEVTGTRIDYSIYGIRPQLTKFADATTLLAAVGYTEVESYAETEELGSQGEEHCFYNSKSGEGVIIGKKSQYDSVKAIKYIKNYKKYMKTRKELRSE